MVRNCSTLGIIVVAAFVCCLAHSSVSLNLQKHAKKHIKVNNKNNNRNNSTHSLVKRDEGSKDTPKFECPEEGKWPDESDCERYFNCQGSMAPTKGWCGPGMSFDTDKGRCDMNSAVNCNDGDRPDWTPPDNWVGKAKATTTTTESPESDETNLADSKDQDVVSGGTTAKPNLKENDRCGFKGLVPDLENCAGYFYCKSSLTKKTTCNDRQLFDEETKSCKEFNKVYCGDRPVNDKSGDVCRSKPNGVYPNLENGCSDFYQCNNGAKTKTGECQKGLKFNLMTLRCDYPQNVRVPCGSKISSSATTTTSMSSVLSFLALSSLIFL